MPRKKARMTALQVLDEIDAIRMICTVVEGTETIDQLLLDLKQRLLKDYGDLRRDTQLQDWTHK